ncbi:protein kinase [Candidatus Woesearchaeota archaeon]|nr:protein kinase [Candidatus Woesearchaeota archaeon]
MSLKYKFSKEEKELLNLNDVKFNEAKPYLGEFDLHDTILLLGNNVSLEEALEFKSFPGYKCYYLDGDTIDNIDIHQKYLSAVDISIANALNLSRDNLKEIILSKPHAFQRLREHMKMHGQRPKEIISTGNSSIVFITDKIVNKFFEDPNLWNHEFDLYELFSKVKPKNIVCPSDESLAPHLSLQYIKGHSLEEYIKKDKSISSNKILKYSSGILNGLLEMRQAGIWYHRDIRPANIMIDEEKDKAVIIDLGIATTDIHAPIRGNSRYGNSGQHPNDLVSLAQVMYSMATGKKLFSKSKSDELTMYKQM